MFNSAKSHKCRTSTVRGQLRVSITEHPNKDLEESECFTAALTKRQKIDEVSSGGSPTHRATDSLCVTVKPIDTPVAPATENLASDTLKNQPSSVSITADKSFETPPEVSVTSASESQERVTGEKSKNLLGGPNTNEWSDNVRNRASQVPSATGSLFVCVRTCETRVAEASTIQGCTVRAEGSSVASIVRKQCFAVNSDENSFPQPQISSERYPIKM